MRTLTALLALLLATSPVIAGVGREDALQPTTGIRADGSLAAGPSSPVGGLLATESVRAVPTPVGLLPAHLARPSVPLPANPPRVVALGEDAVSDVRQSGQSRSGTASWYCGHGSRCTHGYPGGLYAAIRRDLISHRMERARVCLSDRSRCVVVTVIDCNCGPGANLIDLYSAAFIRLAPLSRGRIPVTLEWLR